MSILSLIRSTLDAPGGVTASSFVDFVAVLKDPTAWTGQGGLTKFTFKNINGEVFEIKGPAGMVPAQAEAIFKQQIDTGSLTGIKVGGVLSAATQAAGGLSSAAAMLGSAGAGLTGLLPAGVNLSSLTASLGGLAGGMAGGVKGLFTSAGLGELPGLTGSLQQMGRDAQTFSAGMDRLGGTVGTQISSALQGGAAAFNSLTTGASAATGEISRTLGGGGIATGLSGLSSLPGALTTALTGAAAQVGSVINTAVTNLSSSISGVVANGINIADFTKQGAALAGIAGMKLPDVTGALAGVSKLIGQGASAISNTLGVGKFGLDVKQLETAGLVKPGSAAAFLAGGDADIVAVLKSPAVWTGKDGVTSLRSILKNPALQDKIQQGLMTAGLGQLKQLGIPIDSLKPAALAGLATNAAKSVTDTMSGLAGKLPEGLQSKFNEINAMAANAVKFTKGKVEPAAIQETKPEPASNTVDTVTVSAAAARVVGNEKVPSVAVSSGPFAAARSVLNTYVDFVLINSVADISIWADIILLNRQSSITQEQWNTVNNEFLAAKATWNSRISDLVSAAVVALNGLPPAERAELSILWQHTQILVASVLKQSKENKAGIKDLANKIAT